MTFLDQLIGQPLVIQFGWTLVYFIVQGAIMALLLALVLRRMARRTAGARYAVACVAMIVLALCPIVTFVIASPRAEHHGESVDNGTPSLSASAESETADESPPIRVDRGVRVWPLVVRGTIEQILPYLVSGWVIGVVLFSALLLAGLIRVHWLARMGSTVASPLLLNQSAELARRFGIRRVVRLVETASFAGPAVIGVFRPVILLPAVMLTGLSPLQIEAIIAHELAHIRRHDYLINFLQRIVETLLFYHPAVWWVSTIMRRERENCCDDIALTVVADRVRYAEALTELARLRVAAPRLATAAGGAKLLPRIRRILQPPLPHRAGGSGAIIVALAVLIPLVMTSVAQARAYQPPFSQTVAAMPSVYVYSFPDPTIVIPLTIPPRIRQSITDSLGDWPLGAGRIELSADFQRPIEMRTSSGGSSFSLTWRVDAIPKTVRKTSYGMHVIGSIRLMAKPDRAYVIGLDAKIRCKPSSSRFIRSGMQPVEAQVTWGGPFASRQKFVEFDSPKIVQSLATTATASTLPAWRNVVPPEMNNPEILARQRALRVQRIRELNKRMRMEIEKRPPGPERDLGLQALDAMERQQAEHAKELGSNGEKSQ